MQWLIALVVAVLRALLPELMKKRPPTSEDAARQPEIRRRLRDKVRAKWGKRAVGVLLVLVFVGCGSVRTIYVPEGEPVRLRETVKDVDVWVADKDGNPTPGKMDLLEGWYCLSLDDNEVKGD